MNEVFPPPQYSVEVHRNGNGLTIGVSVKNSYIDAPPLLKYYTGLEELDIPKIVSFFQTFIWTPPAFR